MTKRFVPKGRPRAIPDGKQFDFHLSISMVEDMDKYVAEHNISSRSDLVRQMWQHLQVQEQEDRQKEQQKQQEQQSVSCLSHNLGETTTIEEEAPTEIDIINKTQVELLM